jgi:hypothetical protein
MNTALQGKPGRRPRLILHIPVFVDPRHKGEDDVREAKQVRHLERDR